MLEWVKSHWGATLSTVALLFSLSGMVHQYRLLSLFSVNISDYADIDDFIIASINLFESYKYIGHSNLLIAISLFPYLSLMILRLPVAIIEFTDIFLHSISLIFRKFPYKSIKVKLTSLSLKIREIRGKRAYYILFFLSIIPSTFWTSWELANIQQQNIVFLHSDIQECELHLRGNLPQDHTILQNVRLITGLNSTMFFYQPETMLSGSVYSIASSAIVYSECSFLPFPKD